MSERFVLVMAGGSGSRLWPASTPERPKHLLSPRPGTPTLLAATLDRARTWLGIDRIWVITTADQRSSIIAAHPELPAAQILAEPCGRNTAPAIAFALLQIREHLKKSEISPEHAVVVALPADHHISAPKALESALDRASAHALEHQEIVTLGIEPSRPDTGYGYIERETQAAAQATAQTTANTTATANTTTQTTDAAPIYPVRRFVEKPDAALAERFVASGRFLWNAGIFILPIARTLAAFNSHAAPIMHTLKPVVDALTDGDAVALERASLAAYAALEAAPIDIALMEKLDDLWVLPVALGWNDLGSWAAIHEISATDARGNALLADDSGSVDAIDCDGNLLWSEGIELVAIGIRDLAVIASDGKLLICPLDRAQEVRKAARISADRSESAEPPNSNSDH
ncbi:MAG TPA: hypothetical protein ENJ18_07995 [Nannocystis exedens]|nr:hypothetical protein [Nannocystis exedens]